MGRLPFSCGSTACWRSRSMNAPSRSGPGAAGSASSPVLGTSRRDGLAGALPAAPCRLRTLLLLRSISYPRPPRRKEIFVRRIKAIVYGVGAMNSIATRMMLEKGVDIVGALARSPEKVGRDLGEVAGLGFPTGVLIDDDAERVLATPQADIAVIAVASYMGDVCQH